MFFGGLSIKKDEDVLKKNCPHVVVGTPGRILALVRSRSLNLRNVKHFVLDECDKMLEQLGEHPTGLSSWFPTQRHSHFLGGPDGAGSGSAHSESHGWPELRVPRRSLGEILRLTEYVLLLSPS